MNISLYEYFSNNNDSQDIVIDLSAIDLNSNYAVINISVIFHMKINYIEKLNSTMKGT